MKACSGVPCALFAIFSSAWAISTGDNTKSIQRVSAACRGMLPNSGFDCANVTPPASLTAFNAAQPSLPMPESMIAAVRLAYSSASENSRRLMVVGQPRAGLKLSQIKSTPMDRHFFSRRHEEDAIGQENLLLSTMATGIGVALRIILGSKSGRTVLRCWATTNAIPVSAGRLRKMVR
jgi:hypothetical protein